VRGGKRQPEEKVNPDISRKVRKKEKFPKFGFKTSRNETNMIGIFFSTLNKLCCI
jgi:hypothetical protein